MTQVSAALEAGLATHDVLKEQARQGRLRGEVSGIVARGGTEADISRQIGQAYLRAGEPAGALGAFRQARAAAPVPAKGFTLRPGEQRFAPTGERIAEVAPTPTPKVVGKALVNEQGEVLYREPELNRLKALGNTLFEYNPNTGDINTLAEVPDKPTVVPSGSIVLARDAEGNFAQIAQGLPRPTKEVDVAKRRVDIKKSIRNIVKIELGEPPRRTIKGEHGFEVPNPNYETEIKAYNELKKERINELEVEAGLEEAVLKGGGVPKEGVPSQRKPSRATLSPEDQKAFDIMRANPNNNEFTDEQIIKGITGQ
jgi:hypothetical protein